MKNETKYKLENKTCPYSYRLLDAGMLSINHKTMVFIMGSSYPTEPVDRQDIKHHVMEIKLEIKTARYGTRLEKDAIIVQGIEDEKGNTRDFYFWKKNGQYFISLWWIEHAFCPLFFGNICGNIMRDAIIAAADENAKADKAAKKAAKKNTK